MQDLNSIGIPINPNKHQVNRSLTSEFFEDLLLIFTSAADIVGIVFWDPNKANDSIPPTEDLKYRFYMKTPTKPYHQPLNNLVLNAGEGYFIKTNNN
ncbi:hypothetical protein HY837_01845, partial [archaeon]|nr:hypothetical protein [archaeon]